MREHCRAEVATTPDQGVTRRDFLSSTGRTTAALSALVLGLPAKGRRRGRATRPRPALVGSGAGRLAPPAPSARPRRVPAPRTWRPLTGEAPLGQVPGQAGTGGCWSSDPLDA